MNRLSRAIMDFFRIPGGTLVRFWTAPIRAEPLAMMRIAAGFCVMLSALCSIAPNLAWFWFDDGIIPTAVADTYAQRTGRFSLLAGVTSQAAIIAWFVVWMLALIMVIAGCFTRIACVVAWALAVSFNMRGLWSLNGGDDVAVHLLFYLMIAPAGAAWSIDALRRRVKTYRDPEAGFESPALRHPMEPAMIAPWSVRLMQIQLVLIYLCNGISKLELSETNHYLTGEAVYWVLNDATLTRFAYDMLPAPMWLCQLLSWGTLLFELGFPIFILIARLRPWLLIAGVLFHLGILITIEVGWFGQLTLCYYPVMLSGKACARFAAWLARGGAKETGEQVIGESETGEQVIGVNDKYVVCFDTFCPVCRRSRFALQMMDVGERIEYLDIHDRPAMERALPHISYTQALREMLVIAPVGWFSRMRGVASASNRITAGFDAFRTLAWVLPACYPLLPLLYLPGVAWIGRRIYRAIARNRYRLVHCEQGVCNLHLMALSRDNLDETEIASVVQAARAAATSDAAKVEQNAATSGENAATTADDATPAGEHPAKTTNDAATNGNDRSSADPLEI